jgi:RNA polymerase sigma-70 factor (ECF subfamily)
MSDDQESRLAELMAAAQGGDAGAYQALLRGCVPVVAAAARQQGVSADRVDDVVQDALLALHRARATYDPQRPFLPWLRAIARRRAVDMLRRSGRQARREIHHPVAYETSADPGTHEAGEGLDQSQRARRLADVIATLPDGQRQAVERLALREQTLTEAAEETGRSKTALKVNLHRALKTLRMRLAGRTDLDV